MITVLGWIAVFMLGVGALGLTALITISIVGLIKAVKDMQSEDTE